MTRDSKEFNFFDHARRLVGPTPQQDVALWALTEIFGVTKNRLKEYLHLGNKALTDPIPDFAREALDIYLREIGVSLELFKPREPSIRALRQAYLELIDRITGDYKVTSRKDIKYFRTGVGPVISTEPPHDTTLSARPKRLNRNT